MSLRRSSKDIVTERADAFASRKDSEFMAGPRRMGTSALLDAVAEALERKDPDMNILKLNAAGMTANDIIGTIGKVSGSKELHVLLYGDIRTQWDRVTSSVPKNIFLYRGQELCHQVPVCIRYVHTTK